MIPAGYDIAQDQFVLPVTADKTVYKAAGPKLTVSEEGNDLKVTSSKVNFVFDKKAGVVASYKVGGTEYFNEGFGIQPNFWRARTITTTEAATRNVLRYGNSQAVTSM